MPLIDWNEFAATRDRLGSAMVRMLGYVREDGDKAVAAIESAMKARHAASIVEPAMRLKDGAREFGAERLAQLAEDIELFARDCVEQQDAPDGYVHQVVALRPLWDETIREISGEASPLVLRRPGFGRTMRANAA